MAANKSSSDASVGLLTDVDTSQRNPLGFHVADENGNEYVYLTGVGSTVANDWVFYDELFLTIRAVTSSVGGPIGIAQAAVNATTSFGWYAVRGYKVTGNCISDTFLDDAQCFITSTAGSVDDDSATGATVYNAISRAAGSSTSNTFQIVYPFNLGTAPA